MVPRYSQLPRSPRSPLSPRHSRTGRRRIRGSTVILSITLTTVTFAAALSQFLILNARRRVEAARSLGTSLERSEIAPARDVVAYAITVTHCGKGKERPNDYSNNVTSVWEEEYAVKDSAAIFAHAIRRVSYPHNPQAKYGYKLYAFIYGAKGYGAKMKPCEDILSSLGFHVLLRDIPVEKPLFHIVRSFPKMLEKYPDQAYRWQPQPRVLSDGCCGEREYLKLRMYELVDHPVVVHLDLDSLVIKPLDDLFDVLVTSSTDPLGIEARRRLLDGGYIAPTYDEALPGNITAFYTKDWAGVKKGNMQHGSYVGVQGGFFMARPSLTVYEDFRSIISEGNYTWGWGAGSGWGGSGYGAQICGSMTFQGLMAFFYQVVSPHSAVELNRCIVNQMADNPRITIGNRFSRPTPLDQSESKFSDGRCKDGRETCDDVQCQTWPIEKSLSLHFTTCLKPFSCPDPVANWNNTIVGGTCLDMHREWFQIRRDLEKEGVIEPSARTGRFYPDTYLGYCSDAGSYERMIFKNQHGPN